MPTATGAATPSSAGVKTETARLNALLERAARGETPALDEVQALTQAADRTIRGQAKRLLSFVLMSHARQSAATLMADACEDFDYREPTTLHETLQHLQGLGQAPALIAFNMRAAERLAAHGQLAPALVHLQNAVVTDIGADSTRVNDPKFIRQLATAYERLAEKSREAARIQSPPRGRRRSPSGGKLRLAHVTAQLVDGGHAPSRSIETMLKFADRERFDTYLCITESLAKHELHANQLFSSETSARRAPNRIRRYEQELGIPVLAPRDRRTFITAAADLHAQFAEHEIDVAFFHGSAATPTEWLMCAWQSAPWQADAGFGVPLHCPAVDYQFFEFEETMETLAFLCRERGIPYGFKASGADMSHVEEATAFTREELGIPADHVILGTVGNHLPQRMSARFCRCAARVMRACPKTTFVAVGPGDFSVQREAFGGDLCAGERARVRFVGHQNEPARMTKAFDIYLNSYPDGGGFVLGDAMAASKPVIATVVGDSTFARAGATWIGEENIVRPNTDEAYAARMKMLIEQPEARTELGRRMRKRYEEKFDARRWVGHMTDRIWDIVRADLQ